MANVDIELQFQTLQCQNLHILIIISTIVREWLLIFLDVVEPILYTTQAWKTN